jgi:hypothetical protein
MSRGEGSLGKVPTLALRRRGLGSTQNFFTEQDIP